MKERRQWIHSDFDKKNLEDRLDREYFRDADKRLELITIELVVKGVRGMVI